MHVRNKNIRKLERKKNRNNFNKYVQNHFVGKDYIYIKKMCTKASNSMYH